MIDYLKNIWLLRQLLIKKYDADTPIINGDQMILLRNEGFKKETLSLKGEHILIKENYMLFHERVTVSTKVTSQQISNWLPSLC